MRLKPLHGTVSKYTSGCRCDECRTAIVGHNRQKRHNNPDKYTKINRKYGLKRRYGLSLADYDILSLKQGNLCAICGAFPKQLVIDHNHETGAIRGLLCQWCNSRVGWFERRRDIITKYIERGALSR